MKYSSADMLAGLILLAFLSTSSAQKTSSIPNTVTSTPSTRNSTEARLPPTDTGSVASPTITQSSARLNPTAQDATIIPSPTLSVNVTSQTHIEVSTYRLVTTEVTTGTAPATTTSPPPIGSILGFAFAVIIVVFIFASVGILCCLVGILFFKVSRGNTGDRRAELLQSNKITRRIISVSSSLYASINERGRIRRERSDNTQQNIGNNYTRIPSTLSRTPPDTSPTSTGDPLLPMHMRTYVSNGTLSRDYETDYGEYTSPVFSPAEREEDLQRQLASLGINEIPPDQLSFEEQIGKGQFATVYKALWTFLTDSRPSPQAVSAHVAVKVMNSDKTEEDRVKMLQETVIMGQFNDPNIVSVFGVVTKGTELMIACELMDEDLRAHLRKMRERIVSGEMLAAERNDLPALLLSYCRKIASSFVYLGLKGFIHRDLAARNILVSKEGDCKLSDFGLSRKLLNDDYYLSNGGVIPVKWTAPEAIMYRKYSTKSDVWSYGILLFEILSLGYKPYPNKTNQEVITKVETGYRLPPPPGCPKTIYDLMIKCTHPQPEPRPAFTNVLVSLQRPDYQLLKWTPEDIATSSENARILGAPLEEGECLYTELQHTYISSSTETT